jgi:hypothetical protein
MQQNTCFHKADQTTKGPLKTKIGVEEVTHANFDEVVLGLTGLSRDRVVRGAIGHEVTIWAQSDGADLLVQLAQQGLSRVGVVICTWSRGKSMNNLIREKR